MKKVKLYSYDIRLIWSDYNSTLITNLKAKNREEAIKIAKDIAVPRGFKSKCKVVYCER